MGTFLVKKTVLLLWVTLSLLYLNAIKVKNASIYSKRAVYFSLGNGRCPFPNEGMIKPVGKPVKSVENVIGS